MQKAERTKADRTLVAVFFFAALLCIAVLLYCFLQHTERMVSSGIAGFWFYVVLVLISIVSSLALFGALRSSGGARGPFLGMKVTFGDAAALFFVVLFLGLTRAPTLLSDPGAPAQPAIYITSLPEDPPGAMLANEPVEGMVTGEPRDYRVVVYAFDGSKWWVQPMADTPFVRIENGGRWRTQTHGAIRFAALLTLPGFKPANQLLIDPQIGNEIVSVDFRSPRIKSP